MAKRKNPATSAGLYGISTADAKRYRAEETMRILMRAAEHRKDKGLMRDVQRLAKEQAAALSKVAK